MKQFLLGKFVLAALALPVLYSAVAAQPGRIDLTFPNLFLTGAVVNAIEIQPDGKILVGGSFETRGPVVGNDLVRLNPDGSIDTSFSIGSGLDVGSILSMRLQPNGQLLIGGPFSRINGTTVSRLARLNANGSVDPSFNISGIDVTFVLDIDLQTDGKVLFSGSNLIGTSFVARLTTTGVFDQTAFFFPGGGEFTVTDVPNEGKILVGGRFTGGIARLTSTGAVDTSFTASISSVNFGLHVKAMPLAGGKILVWGKFDTVNEVTRRNIAILNNNGSLDTSFNPDTSGTDAILSTALQPDGRIVIAGRFPAANTLPRGNVGRLNADGSVDTTFDPRRGAKGEVRVVKIQGPTRLLLGGPFYRYQTIPRRALVRTLL